MRDTYDKAIGEDVLVFLDHYLNLIGTRFMNDEQLDELCQRIYKNHRQALDLIYERVGSPESRFLAEVANAVGEDNRWRVVHQNDKVVNSVPVTWLKWLPPLGSLYDDPRVWIVLKFELSGETRETLDFFVEMHGLTDLGMQKKLAEFLIAESPKFGFKRKQGKVSGNYTKVSGSEHILEWGEDDEPEAEAIRTAVKKTRDDLYPRLEKLALVLKPLCKIPATSKH